MGHWAKFEMLRDADVSVTGLWTAWSLTHRMCPSCPQCWRRRSPLVLRALAASRLSPSNPQHALEPRKLRVLVVEVPGHLPMMHCVQASSSGRDGSAAYSDIEASYTAMSR